MKLSIHGCRGSVPTSSGSTHKYGGNTSCFEIITEIIRLFLMPEPVSRMLDFQNQERLFYYLAIFIMTTSKVYHSIQSFLIQKTRLLFQVAYAI